MEYRKKRKVSLLERQPLLGKNEESNVQREKDWLFWRKPEKWLEKRGNEKEREREIEGAVSYCLERRNSSLCTCSSPWFSTSSRINLLGLFLYFLCDYDFSCCFFWFWFYWTNHELIFLARIIDGTEVVMMICILCWMLSDFCFSLFKCVEVVNLC